MKFSKLASLVLCALTLATLGCGRAERLNVLVVTFDTTRADHIASYGNERASTPRVDQLAAEGVLFEHAFSAVPITAPSHSTIMTGKYPLAHGVRDNGMFVLPDNQQTLAETLKANGYATGAAIAAFPLLSRFGVDQGFDFYDDNVEPQPQGVFGDRAFPEAQIYMDERRAGRVNEALFPWLDEHHDKPFFAWAHYFDPHQPFDPPPPYDQLFADDLYLGELAYTDESFGRLLDKLKELGVYDKTIIVLAADHGEGRGEHNELTHSTLVYNTTLHVPLIIRMPGATGGRRVSANAGTVDIVPTVLDLLGIPIPNEVQGVSLVDAMNSDESALDRPLYAETLAPRLGFGWGELRALIDGKDKYIFGPRPELFDIRADPRELDNRLAGEAELGDRMQRRLAAFLRENAADNLDAAVSMDEETRQKLQALGYLGSGAGADEPIEEVLRQGGIPPQDTVTYINDISQVKIKIFRHQSLVALEILETLLDNDPENPSYLEMSVTANVQLGRLDEALAIIERARALDATSVATSTILLQLGSLYFYQGDLDKAEPLLRQSLDLEPLALGHYLLASVYTARGDLAAERAALEAALDADPSYAPARVDLAIRYAQAGDRERAARELDRALRDQPYFAKGYYNYGAFLVEGGDLDGALSQFERAVELDPNYWLGYLALVELSLALDKPTDAKQHYQTLLRRAPNRDETAQARERIEGIS